MTPESRETLDALKQKLKKASLAQLGGFRPPEDPTVSWFGRGVCKAGENLPIYAGKPMFPLLQIRIDALPYIPPELKETALLVLFFQQDDYPFGKPHGEGWLIREYASLDKLELLPEFSLPAFVRPFPIRWHLVADDAPGWEDAWSILDLDHVNNDDEASDAFFNDFNRYAQTKVSGYPFEIQHGVGLEDYVFQVGSEEKAHWMWADNGVAYFFKSPTGEWRWKCQFY